MSSSTNIQWTDVTDNLIVVEGGGWWCRMISPGCANCYAAALNQNEFYGGNKLPYSGEPPRLTLRTEVISGWVRQRHPKRHFVASMTDVFGDWVPQYFVDTFLSGMRLASRQTFQILTKRPDVAKHCIDIWLDARGLTKLPENIWIGVSVEDQKRADERIPILLSIPAKVRFLSIEPMLEGIDLKLTKPVPLHDPEFGDQHEYYEVNRGIRWAIFGGESGPKARPCNIEWIRDGVRQCRAANVAAFVKQLGSRPFSEDRIRCEWKWNHSKGGDPEEWPEDFRVRQFPEL